MFALVAGWRHISACIAGASAMLARQGIECGDIVAGGRQHDRSGFGRSCRVPATSGCPASDECCLRFAWRGMRPDGTGIDVGLEGSASPPASELGPQTVIQVPYPDDDVHDLAGLMEVNRYLFASGAEERAEIAASV